ncbi:autotransporter outer membrane beta-barrel domain-containing protein [Helicobacter sp. 23-1045]
MRKIWQIICIALFSIIPPPLSQNLNANPIELSTICTPNAECKIDTIHKDKNIQNSAPFSTSQIKIETQITTFTNTSDITSTDEQSFYINNNDGKIINFINKGTISGGIRIFSQNAISTLENYGTMRGIWTQYKPIEITINNLGTILTNEGSYINTLVKKAAHFAFESDQAKLVIQNYTIKIIENANEFNNFTGYDNKTENKNSHLIITYNNYTPTDKNLYFKDKDSKFIIDFSGDFEMGAGYKIAKLVVSPNDGEPINALNIDFSRLMLKDADFYDILESGEYFIVRVKEKSGDFSLHTPITELYKSNLRTMNNFQIMTSAMIFPRKFAKSQNLTQTPQNSQTPQKRTIRRIKKVSSLRGAESNAQFPSLRDSVNLNSAFVILSEAKNLADSAILKQNETFFYKNAESTAKNRRIQRNISRNPADSANRPQIAESTADSAKNYYFIFTPFINHNSFAQAGNYALSGFDYGFITAFSANIAESHTLGAHFALTYGTLRDKHDKDLAVKNLNLFGGLHYKIDLPYALFLKAYGDFFYFSNDLKTQFLADLKPQNLGFGANLTFGKTFDFRTGGALSLEAGFDYKALKSKEIKADSAIYQNALFNLIYGDLGISYANYFSGFGINFGVGAKFNLAPKLAKSKVLVRSENFDFALDSDKILGYANAGISYLLQKSNFDMEFGLQYFGNFGDKGISNGGGFEWRVLW